MQLNVGTLAKPLLALGIALGSATMGAPTAKADAVAGVPYHAASTVNCGVGTQGRTVTAFAPKDMRSRSGAIENVYWRSNLYRWDGYTWKLYNGTKPWLHAAANGNGLLGSYGAIWYNGAGQLNNLTYTGLPAGSYAIGQFYFWSNGGLTHSEWSRVYNNASAGFCTIR